MRRHLPIAFALAAICAVLLVACSDDSSSEAARQHDDPRPERVSPADAAAKPNVIFVYTDDQNVAEFKPRYMPRTFKLLADPGTVFSDYVVATPLCCPSRATYLTGSYPHNSGVFSNRRGYSQLKGKFNTLPVWMRNAGYRTAWIGKFLQGYESGVPDPLVAAPGIDDWYATFEPRYYDYDVAENGESVHYGNRSRDYYTNVITRQAVDLIDRQAKRERPLFMTINNLAPHHGGGDAGRCTDVVPPAPRDEKAYAGAGVPRTPSFDEKDVSDKPASVRRDRLSPAKIERLDLAYGCRLASLRGVDRSISEIYGAVKRAEELDNTVFVVTSDNGILQGQHRIGGKNVPYAEGVDQPLVILAGRRALGATAVSSVPGLAANVDLAPTILDFAGAEPCARPGNCRKLDGQSLVPLLRGRGGGDLTTSREVLIEGGKGGGDCLYAGIRTVGLNYIERAEEGANGTCDRNVAAELYDLDGSLTGNPDPFELANLLSPRTPGSDDPEVVTAVSRLEKRLRELRACSGAACR